jgi:phage gpG-like protein
MEKILSRADYREFGQIIRDEIRRGIEQQIDADGRPFPPLKPETIKRKRKRGYQHPTKRLIATGNLWKNQRVEESPRSVILDVGPTRDEIAEYQQGGTDTIPAVNFFAINNRAKQRIRRQVRRRLLTWTRNKVASF